jgi:hypothetical protein
MKDRQIIDKLRQVVEHIEDKKRTANPVQPLFVQEFYESMNEVEDEVKDLIFKLETDLRMASDFRNKR